jgi:hypothetical protein
MNFELSEEEKAQVRPEEPTWPTTDEEDEAEFLYEQDIVAHLEFLMRWAEEPPAAFK